MREQLDSIAGMLGRQFPKVESMLREAADDINRLRGFPCAAREKSLFDQSIESTFATVRLRTKVTKGPGSRAADLAMAYQLSILDVARRLVGAAGGDWNAADTAYGRREFVH